MGAKIHFMQKGLVYCEAERLKGCEIQLDYPSVGATENIMLAAALAEGETIIRNAAKEPEIVDLQNYLIGIGVNIWGAGTSAIRISGSNSKLRSVVHNVIPDRIVAGTYMVASAMTGGDVVIRNIVPEHINSIIYSLRDCGCSINIKRNMLRVSGPARPRSIDIIRTLPYPGFPTDMQAQMVSMLSISRGESVIVETVFENRYKHIEELIRMGANIKLEGRIAIIKGVKKLKGANICAKDLRGGAALIMAGLVADGETQITGLKHVDRGYEDIEEKLTGIGASIVRVQSDDV